MTVELPSSDSSLDRPLILPCGISLKNRLIKSAMSDSLGDGVGNPTKTQIRLYERWAEGGCALSLIGEVQTNPGYPEKPGNLVLNENADKQMLRELATRGAVNGAAIWPQLGHAGALAHQPVSRPKGPSPLDVEGLQCEGMTLENIRELPDLYARSASLAQELGFGGVQIHAGHGFLFSQFLSPLFNHRDDEYGGSVEGRFRIIGEVIHAVRNAVGSGFPIGIKINSTDKLVGGLDEADALQVVRLLDQTSVDLIDISGGTYFPGAAASSDGAATGPYFKLFAQQAREVTSIPVQLTGGFETRVQASEALSDGSADVISLARAMALDPALPNSWLTGVGGDPEYPRFDSPPRGGVTAWYSMRLTALGEETENQFDISPAASLEAYDARDAERSVRWTERFS
ncbi:MAG: hypothetical protein KTR32_20200 [Granulosicoccus sp.]|nr:hypothetical protein [Granulosicoccus sp.]